MNASVTRTRRVPDWLWLAGCVLLAVGLPYVGFSNYISGLIVLAAVYALLGLSLNLVFGYLGFTSFGHAAFFGLGAYFAVLLNVYLGVDFWLAAALSALPGVALGALIGFSSLRIGGAYFAIATMTAAEIVRLVADNWVDLTRGPMGMMMPRPAIGALAPVMSFQQYYLAIVLLVTGLAFWTVKRLLRSPIGRSWIAIRESLDLAESVGIPTLRIRVQNIALSGAMAAIAGALIIPKILIVTPVLLTPLYSATAVLVVILGGRGTLAGPVIGAAIFAWLPEFLRSAGEMRFAIFGVLLILVVRLLPKGLVSLWPARRSAPAIDIGAAAAIKDKPVRPAPSGAPIFEVSGLTRRYGALVALNDVSFSLRKGEILGLMGPNGAGKSTCVSLASGFVRPTKGQVKMFGEDVSATKPYRRNQLGLARTFQQTTVFDDLSVYDNILIATYQLRPTSLAASIFQGAGFRRDEEIRGEAVRRLIAQVGLEARAAMPARSLAYGEQRLLSIATALATDPKILLLDEPAAGLNPVEAATLTDLLRALSGQGLAIILVEHNVRMMMSVCDRLVVLHHGELITEGDPATVRNHPMVNEAYFGVGQKQ
ncbi:branched-chain amino acid ABC transporter ATP-binding protein/permease [Bosea sp. (in: a-proteobacteria)]|uniref:branched-chain amino acid ABC transporter ATP-binding protein/permease n=1 Tax=Bosea sp. (in: a-proteobacteria) TaxID=1871050 RepID=UPI002635F41C|nr:branched-chain amino acid ABC transporter ATP-binding protein/permease [Bosea sp. (in: a-proteobacteria)]MCO5090908.1 branched-chain amino acid ABC transporter ATP-binding protein/permease [Bosea sp. (in: a-proteobacteria)]